MMYYSGDDPEISDSFDANIKFVEMVKKHPCIYDLSSCKDHSKRDATEQSWITIGKELKLSVTKCKKRWKNLRTAFTRSMKKPLGSSAHKKVKDYYLKDAMQFLLPFMKANNQNGYIQYLPASTEGSDSDVSDEEVKEEDIDDTNSINDTLFISNQPKVSSQTCRALSSENSKKRARSPIASHCMYVADELEKTETPNTFVLKHEPSNNAFQEVDHLFISQSSSADHEFLKSLLPDISKMSDYQKRQFKKRTLDVIDSILCDDFPQKKTCTCASTST